MEKCKRLRTLGWKVFSPFQYHPYKTRLQDLPLEMLTEILSYLPLSEAVRLGKECMSLRHAVALRASQSLRNVHASVRQRVWDLKSQLTSQLMEESDLLCDQVECLHFWWNALNDLSLLEVSVRRFRSDLWAWSGLAGRLAGLIERIQADMQASCQRGLRHGGVNVHPTLDNFLNRFTKEVEVHFYNSKKLVPFEVRITDLLFCCPYGNIKMVLNQGYRRVKVYSHITFLKTNKKIPVISEMASKYTNETEILHFLREYVRYINSIHVRSVISKMAHFCWIPKGDNSCSKLDRILSLITCDNEPSIEHRERILDTEDKEEVYERRSLLNKGQFSLTCFLQITQASSGPTWSPADCKGIRRGYSHACVACNFSEADNAFCLSVKKDNGTSFEETTIIYNSEIKNYSFHNSFRGPSSMSDV